jgi:hypothetical protein
VSTLPDPVLARPWRRPLVAVARHGSTPPPAPHPTVVPDEVPDALTDGVLAAVAAWARQTARARGCRCRWWLDAVTVRTAPDEVVVEVWGHDPGCPSGPDADGRDRWAVVHL